jgi:hypothetical protein
LLIANRKTKQAIGIMHEKWLSLAQTHPITQTMHKADTTKQEKWLNIENKNMKIKKVKAGKSWASNKGSQYP